MDRFFGMVRAALEASVHRRLIAFAAVTALTFAMASGCNNQGEGERCDPLDGNDDCSSGLVCQTTSVYGGSSAGNATNVCCPANNAPSTAFGCTSSTGGTGAATFDAGPDADASNDVDSATGTPEDGSIPDSATDSAPDSATDSATDASPAPVDSGVDAQTDSSADSAAD